MVRIELSVEDRCALYEAVEYACEERYYDLKNSGGFYTPEDEAVMRRQLAAWELLMPLLAAAEEPLA